MPLTDNLLYSITDFKGTYSLPADITTFTVLPSSSSYNNTSKSQDLTLPALCRPFTNSTPHTTNHTTPQHIPTMSAPNAGRQSPDPETQAGKQATAPAATNVNDQGGAPDDKAHSADASKDALSGLASNPKGVLEDEAAKKTSKN